MVKRQENLLFITVDIGNTKTSFALWKHGNYRPVMQSNFPNTILIYRMKRLLGNNLRWQNLIFPARNSQLRAILTGNIRFLVCSVNDTLMRSLFTFLNRAGISHPTLRLLQQKDVPLKVLYQGRIGLDRLAAATGAAANSRNCVIVSAGTALTVDMVSKGVFLGGAILPGEALMLRAINLTQGIKLSGRTKPSGYPGRSTAECTSEGIRSAYLGGAAMLSALAVKSLNSPQIFLTGGAAKTVAPFLPQACVIDPILVHRGLALILLATE